MMCRRHQTGCCLQIRRLKSRLQTAQATKTREGIVARALDTAVTCLIRGKPTTTAPYIIHFQDFAGDVS